MNSSFVFFSPLFFVVKGGAILNSVEAVACLLKSKSIISTKSFRNELEKVENGEFIRPYRQILKYDHCIVWRKVRPLSQNETVSRV